MQNHLSLKYLLEMAKMSYHVPTYNGEDTEYFSISQFWIF